MKLKISWSAGIIIAMVSFMVFILSFVYKSLTMDEYQHELVSEDYYKDELHYQEEIDKLNNAKSLEQDLILSNSKEGVLIQFPDDMTDQKITGTIYFQRLANKKLDFTEEIELDSQQQLISAEKMVAGKWVVKIDWQYGQEQYLFKDTWFY